MRSRFRPSPAMIVACIALFVALGGTAVALNGSNTVQSDDIGPGAQVKAPDVAANAVNGAKIVDNSVTGRDVNESTLNGFVRGRMLDFNLAANGPNVAPTPIATVGPYKLRGKCFIVGGSLYLNVYANGPAGFAEAEWSEVHNDTDDSGDHSYSSRPSANVDTQVLTFGVQQGFNRYGGTLLLRSNTGKLVQVVFSTVLDRNAPACHVWGTATTE